MENYQQAAEQFWKDGYLIFENVFSDAVMDEANEMILQHYGLDPEWEHTDEFITKSAVEVVPWFPYREGNTKLDTIDKDERKNAITSAILKDGWENLYCMAMFSKQGSKGQAWHQDCPPESKLKYNLNRLVYTHDINGETGGEIIIYPETHKAGVLPTGVPDADIERTIKGVAEAANTWCHDFDKMMEAKVTNQKPPYDKCFIAMSAIGLVNLIDTSLLPD